MNRWRYAILPALALSFLVFSQSAGAQTRNNKPAIHSSTHKRSLALQSQNQKLNAEVIRTTTAYKQSLERLLGIYEGEVENLTQEVEKRRTFYQKGYISKREIEESEEELSHVEANARETRERIMQANLVLTESSARDKIVTSSPLPPGGYSETPVLIRFSGGTHWSLANAGKIERFFKQTFGHSLPISALGQTAVHDRMGFDHHDAMDVALHPDSPEGRTLMSYLRRQGIPFIGFRDKVAGSATGAHIHIGRPSSRVASLRAAPF